MLNPYLSHLIFVLHSVYLLNIVISILLVREHLPLYNQI